MTINRFRISSPFLGLLAAFALALLTLTPVAMAQDETKPLAYPEDVASVDNIMAAIYDVISGPAGEQRDWERFYDLFVDGARLIPRSPTAPNGVIVFSPDDYVERVDEIFLRDGFFEAEIGRKTEQYGDIVHVLSAYESKRNADDPEPFARGVNSFQLLNHNDRWWIVTIYWQGETEDNPIPADLLREE